jgi:hypothetical protein
MIEYQYITDYLRLTSYALVILTTLFSLRYKNHTNFIAIGNIMFAFVLFAGRLLILHFGIYNLDYNAYVITPASMIWALIHFERFMRISHYKGGQNGNR